jgi:Holliday junction resolvase RusA-like endonuclease
MALAEIDCDFDIPRTTAQQRRFGSQGNYAGPLLRRAQASWLALARKYAPKKPLEGAVSLNVSLYYHSARVRDAEYKTTRPDLDNTLKLIQDALVKAGWLKDDAAISAIVAEKTLIPGNEHVYIFVEEIAE